MISQGAFKYKDIRSGCNTLPVKCVEGDQAAGICDLIGTFLEERMRPRRSNIPAA